MTVLSFTGPAATAAAFVITGTSLQYNWPRAIRPVEADQDTFKVVVDDSWMWSSGELKLIDLLRALAFGVPELQMQGVKAVCDSTTYAVCDSTTYAVCVEALGLLEATP